MTGLCTLARPTTAAAGLPMRAALCALTDCVGQLEYLQLIYLNVLEGCLAKQTIDAKKAMHDT